MADLKESFLFHSIKDQEMHWYYHHKNRVIKLLLRKYLPSASKDHLDLTSQVNQPLRGLDMGAGNGIISRSIGGRICNQEIAWDLVDSAYDQEELGADPIDMFITLYTNIPARAVYDVIVAIDVIEHIENDIGIIALLAQHLAIDGLLVICVPAFQFLWSSHDIFLEHYRRYSKSELALKMRNAKLKVIESGHLYILLFPLIAAIRVFGQLVAKDLVISSQQKGSDLTRHRSFVNYFLLVVMKFERYLTRLFPPFGHYFGVSCYCIGIQERSDEISASSIISRMI